MHLRRPGLGWRTTACEYRAQSSWPYSRSGGNTPSKLPGAPAFGDRAITASRLMKISSHSDGVVGTGFGTRGSKSDNMMSPSGSNGGNWERSEKCPWSYCTRLIGAPGLDWHKSSKYWSRRSFRRHEQERLPCSIERPRPRQEIRRFGCQHPCMRGITVCRPFPEAVNPTRTLIW